MAFPPILQTGEHSQAALVVLEGMGRSAEISGQIPDLVPVDVAERARKPVFPAHGRPLRGRSLRAEKVVVGETPAPDRPVPEHPAHKHLVFQQHFPADFGHVGAGIFVFKLRGRIAEIGVQS